MRGDEDWACTVGGKTYEGSLNLGRKETCRCLERRSKFQDRRRESTHHHVYSDFGKQEL